jgi:hypothetical protein
VVEKVVLKERRRERKLLVVLEEPAQYRALEEAGEDAAEEAKAV